MREANERKIEFAAYIGIDWADQKHAWTLQTSSDSDVEQGTLLHRPEAVEAWTAVLYRRFGGRPIAIALEQSRGSLLFMLLKYEHLVLFPVNPSTLVNYRKGFRPSGAKSDPSDATLLVDLLKDCASSVRIQSRHVLFSSWWKADESSSTKRSAIRIDSLLI